MLGGVQSSSLQITYLVVTLSQQGHHGEQACILGLRSSLGRVASQQELRLSLGTNAVLGVYCESVKYCHIIGNCRGPTPEEGCLLPCLHLQYLDGALKQDRQLRNAVPFQHKVMKHAQFNMSFVATTPSFLHS